MNLSTLDEVINKKNGAYWDKELPNNLQRYTIYVYMKGDDEDVAGEEIDVDAVDKKHALKIAEAAWKRDYQGPVKKMKVVGPRIGLYM